MDKDLTPQAMFLGEPGREAPPDRPPVDDPSNLLTPVELRLLAALASQPGRIFTRHELLRSLYTDHRVVCVRTVDTHVKNLRRKLRARRVDLIVRTSYGRGYSLAS